jgi:nucleotide-binding universal stress UspA family protein
MEGTPKTLAINHLLLGFPCGYDLYILWDIGYLCSTLLLIYYSFPWGEGKAVKIKPMLVRLQSATGRDDLIGQMVLLPEPKTPFCVNITEAKSVNLIVGYDASPNSHTALDIAFWMAHQTRLATNIEVTVQAVYVVENNHSSQYANVLSFAKTVPTLECPVSEVSQFATPVLTPVKFPEIKPRLHTNPVTHLQQADKILWQARSLAEEWQGSFKSHLRFGCVATELKKVVESEAADVLFLGCKSVNHPMIRTLGSNFPCAVLGIPSRLDE